MATVSLRGQPVTTNGELPTTGVAAPAFKLTGSDLNDVALEHYRNKFCVISVVPSLDTRVCAISTQRFEKLAIENIQCAFLIVSADLPFAQQRFCRENQLKHIITLSMMRNKSFAKNYGLLIQDGPMAGLTARAVIVINPEQQIAYTQLVEEITHEPNYDAAISVIQRQSTVN